MKHGFQLLVGIFSFLCITMPLRSDDGQLVNQQERQKEVKADTDYFVRRVATMLRVLEYYKLDEQAERQVLAEVAGTLNKLSTNEMVEVIAKLDSAARAPNRQQSERELEEAYARHRAILTKLQGLMTKFDAAKSLDDAANRLERIASTQLDHHLTTAHLLKQLSDLKEVESSPSRVAQLIARRLGRPLNAFIRQQSDEQEDLAKETTNLLQQINKLKPLLSESEQKKVAELEKAAQNRKLLDAMTEAANKFQSDEGRPDEVSDEWKKANDLQWQTSVDLKNFARLLRSDSGKEAALREANKRLTQALQQQEQLQAEAKAEEEKIKKELGDDPKNEGRKPIDFKGLNKLPTFPFGRSRFDVTKALEDLEKANEVSKQLSDAQARLEYETRDIRDLLAKHADKAAKLLSPAQTAMREAEAALRKMDLENAKSPQEQARASLEDAKKAVEKALAEATTKRMDPLKDLKKLEQEIAKVLEKQKDTQKTTKNASNPKEDYQLPILANPQKNLAKETSKLSDDAAGKEPQAVPELAKAAEAMKTAAAAMQQKQGEKAVEKQDQAIDALKKAQKAIGEKVANLEKRRDEIAKLEEAAKKLDQLVADEASVAKKADQLANKGMKDGKQLAQQQDKITPKAQELSKDLQKSAENAAKEIAKATEKMQMAKANLEKNQAKPGSENAKSATEQLKKAQQELAKALQEKKAEQIAEQTAMQPKETNPFNAAKQLEKAIEEAKKAAKQAADATAKNKNPDEIANLAKAQQQIADQAKQLPMAKAENSAKDATEALEKKDLDSALKKQGEALAKLDKAAADPNFPQPKNKTLPPRPSEAKGAEQGKKSPQENGMAKKGQPQSTQPKAKGPETGTTKNAKSPMAAQSKENSAKTASQKTPGSAKEQPGTEKQGNDPKKGEGNKIAKAGSPKEGKAGSQAKAGQPKDNAQAKSGDTKSAGSAKDMPATKTAAAKSNSAKASAGKQGKGAQTEAKMASGKSEKSEAGKAKSGGTEPALAKASSGQPSQMAKGKDSGKQIAQMNAKQLAQAQKQLMQATQSAAASQSSTEKALASLGQAQSQAPSEVMPLLDKAGKELAKALQDIQKGSPNDALPKQQNAIAQMNQAMASMQAAMAKMQPNDAKSEGQSTQVASNQPGQQGEGKGDASKPGNAKNGQAQGKQGEKASPGQEKNLGKGKGDRIADGKRTNNPSELLDVEGDGHFLNLPPRQRELIRQAISGELPPEYAAQIRQYYINISRGRPATLPTFAPPKR